MEKQRGEPLIADDLYDIINQKGNIYKKKFDLYKANHMKYQFMGNPLAVPQKWTSLLKINKHFDSQKRREPQKKEKQTPLIVTDFKETRIKEAYRSFSKQRGNPKSINSFAKLVNSTQSVKKITVENFISDRFNLTRTLQ